MTEEQIVKMLIAPPKPDLEGFKKELCEEGEFRHGFSTLSGLDESSIKDWLTTSTIMSAKGMITKKHFKTAAASRRLVYDNVHAWYYRNKAGKHLNADQVNEVRDATKEFVTKQVLDRLPKDHPGKKCTVNECLNGFELNFTLGYNPSPHSTKHEYEEWFGWDERDDRDFWPSHDQTNISGPFLERLRRGDHDAELLAKYGFQNMLVSDNKRVVLISLPPAVALTDVRGGLQPHSLHGPAVKMKSKDKYFIRGVEFTERLSWTGEILDSNPYFDYIDTDKGCLKPGMVKQIITQVTNTEQRRALLELVEPEEFLKACEAKKIDGPTEAGNELYEVEIGMGSSWRKGHPHEDNPEQMKSRDSKATMLKYECPSTGRVYTKFVPPEYRKADEAQAWSHHFTLEEYLSLENQS